MQIAPLDLTPSEKDPNVVYGALPYKDVPTLERTWDNAPWHQDFGFEDGLGWCEAALIEAVPSQVCGLEKAHFEDTVFGRRPQENFNGEDNPDGVVIRDIDSKIVLVVPQSYYDAGLPQTRQKLAQLQVPIRLSRFRALPKPAILDTSIPLKIKKSWREEVEVAFPIIVVRHAVPYDAQYGGFDFSALPATAEEVTDDANFV